MYINKFFFPNRKKKPLTCMSSFVDFKVFRPGEYFSTAWEWTGEWLLSGVYSDVIDKFVLGFKRLPFSRTFFPKTYVVGLLWSPDMFYCHMSNQFVHGTVSFGAKFFHRVFRLQPFADEFLLDRLPHIPEKSSWSVVVRAEVHIQIETAVAVQRRRSEWVCPGACHLTQVIRSNVHFSRYS